MTQIKKRININSFFRGGWATGWGRFGSSRRTPFHPPWPIVPLLSMSLSPLLSLPPFHSYSFRPLPFFHPSRIRPFFPFLSLLIFFSLKYQPLNSIPFDFFRERASERRMFKTGREIISTNDSKMRFKRDLRDALNASHLLLTVVRKIEGWPSKHTRWYDALTWLLKRGFELF